MRRIMGAVLAALLLLGLALVSTSVGQAAPAGERVDVLRDGDTLSKRYGKAWPLVCKHNQLADCGKVSKGQRIRVPATVSTGKSQGTAATPKQAAAAPTVGPRRDAEGYIPWYKVGVRPMGNFKGPAGIREAQVIAMEKSGVLSDADITEVIEALRKGTAEKSLMGKDTKFDFMSAAMPNKVLTFHKVRYVGDEDEVIYRIRLSSGKVVTIVEKCANVGIEEAPPPPPVEVLPPPPPVELPPPPPVVELPPPPPAPPPAVKVEQKCFDWNVLFGVEKELIGGNSLAGYLPASVYPICWRGKFLGEHGIWGLGLGAKASAWQGRVDSGHGKYDGYWGQVGPALEWISDKWWNFEVKAPAIGYLRENFRHDSGYKSKRTAITLGLDTSVNLYQERAKKKQGFLREVQLNGSVAVPLSVKAEHSWRGDKIEDTRDLRNLDLIAHVGARAFVGGNDKIHPYVQGGLFAELPGTKTGSLRLGAAFGRNRCVGVHAGPNFNLENGDIAPLAVGAWWDASCTFRAKRIQIRNRQIEHIPADQAAMSSAPGIGQNLAAPEAYAPAPLPAATPVAAATAVVPAAAPVAALGMPVTHVPPPDPDFVPVEVPAEVPSVDPLAPSNETAETVQPESAQPVN